MSVLSNQEALRRPFYRLSEYLRERYGERVFKVSLRGGFTCPNRDGTLGSDGCTFCSGTALEPLGFRPGQTIEEQLRRGIAYIRRRHKARRYIAYFHDYSATYGISARDLAALFRPAVEEEQVVALALSTRPDCLSPPVLGLLREISRRKNVWLELGLQLADDAILRELGRGHTVACFAAAVAACSEHRLPVCAHVILGLPDAAPEQELATARLLGDLGVWGVKLHAFHVIAGTQMERRLAAGVLPLLTREQHVQRVIDFVEQLPPGLVVHRVTAEAPPRLTVAPEWTINKMAVLDAVLAGFEQRRTWQGRAWAGAGGQKPEVG